MDPEEENTQQWAAQLHKHLCETNSPEYGQRTRRRMRCQRGCHRPQATNWGFLMFL